MSLHLQLKINIRTYNSNRTACTWSILAQQKLTCTSNRWLIANAILDSLILVHLCSGGRRRRRRLLGLCLLLLFVQLLDGLDLFFELHAAILEPYFYLPLREAQSVRHFDSSPSGQVMVRVEFLLQLQGLVSRVRLTASSPKSICAWKERNVGYETMEQSGFEQQQVIQPLMVFPLQFRKPSSYY